MISIFWWWTFLPLFLRSLKTCIPWVWDTPEQMETTRKVPRSWPTPLATLGEKFFLSVKSSSCHDESTVEQKSFPWLRFSVPHPVFGKLFNFILSPSPLSNLFSVIPGLTQLPWFSERIFVFISGGQNFYCSSKMYVFLCSLKYLVPHYYLLACHMNIKH